MWGVLLPFLAIALFFLVPVKYLPFGMTVASILAPAVASMTSQIYLIGYMALTCAAVVLVCKYAPEMPPIDTNSEARNRAVMYFVIGAPMVAFAYAIPENLGGSGLLLRLAQAVGVIGSVVILIRGFKIVCAVVLAGILLGGCKYIFTGH